MTAPKRKPPAKPNRLGAKRPHRATDSRTSPHAPAKGQPAPGQPPVSPVAPGARLAVAEIPPGERPIRPVKTRAQQEREQIALRKAKRDALKATKVTTPSQKEAAKIHRKKGSKLPLVQIAKKGRDHVEWRRGEYAVYMDRGGYSCIRVGDGSVVHFIPMTGKALDVHRSDQSRFYDRWKPYMYPLNNAAEVFAEGAKIRGIKLEAREYLEKILGRSLTHLRLEVDVPKRKVIVTTVKNGEKTVESMDKAPSAKKDTPQFLSREDAAKAIKAGGKLKIGRDNDTRKGSLRWAAIEAVRACKDVPAALKAKFKHKGITQEVKFTDVRSAVRRGYVTIVSR